LGKILIKVLSKIDLSSPIDKSDQQDSTIFLSGNHKIGYFTIDATFMPVTRVNYLIQASDDLQLAKDYIILEFGPTGVFIRAMQFTKRLKH
jgi:hypothetical protein